MSGKKIEDNLPSGWASAFLGDVLTLEYGKGLSEEKRDKNGNIPVYGSSGIVGYHSSYLLKESSIIVGRKGAIGSVYLSNGPSWPIDTVYYIIPPKELIPKFVFYLLKTLSLNLLDKSTAIPGLNRNDVYKKKVIIAPFNEQTRIVGRVEVLFSYLDAGVAQLRMVQAQLKRYRQAVLKAAFEGKLTEEWRKTHKHDIEPAEALLERIRQERRKDPKYKELQPIDTSELPELPENWTWTRLGEVTFLSNERYNPKISENEKFVGLEHIESGTGRILSIGKSIETKSIKNRFKKGDLLYGKLRPYLNKVWVAEFDGVCSTDILVFKQNSYISNKYLLFCLLNQNFVKYASQRMSGVQHPRVSFQVISNYLIPLPPLTEQIKIAAEIQRTFSIIDHILDITGQSLRQSEPLRQSVLRLAFEGRLVPQDPSDEPADKLLERIKAERAKAKDEKASKKVKGKSGQLELSNYV